MKTLKMNYKKMKNKMIYNKKKSKNKMKMKTKRIMMMKEMFQMKKKFKRKKLKMKMILMIKMIKYRMKTILKKEIKSKNNRKRKGHKIFNKQNIL